MECNTTPQRSERGVDDRKAPPAVSPPHRDFIVIFFSIYLSFHINLIYFFPKFYMA